MSKALSLRGGPRPLRRGNASGAAADQRDAKILPADAAGARLTAPSPRGLCPPEAFARGAATRAAIPLVARLCAALAEEGVRYCHWKSNWRLERWLRGEGDLDLLIDRAHAGRFAEVVARLGFKPALPTRDRQVPGVCDFYGFDSEANRLVHLHVHHQLVLGHDLTKNFHLPLEDAYLASCDARGMPPVPAPAFELVVFVLRMVLKFAPGEAALRRVRRGGAATSAAQRELEFLAAGADGADVRSVLARHLPFVGEEFFDECSRSLRAGAPARERFAVRRRLEKLLASHARRARPADALTKLARRVSRLARERVLGRSSRKRLARGGAVIALVGGDGAGKTTSVNRLHGWLSKKFVARKFHLGRPRRSPVTMAVIVALRILRLLGGSYGKARAVKGESGGADFPGYLQLFRWVCAARDRHRLYAKARRFASAGGVAVCDRFPVPQLRLMEGANVARFTDPARANRLVRLLRRAEESYYARILPPDVLIVLRVEPEIAVRRKPKESAEHVRSRSRELWEQDWHGTRAQVVDAGRPPEEVFARLQAIVWDAL